MRRFLLLSFFMFLPTVILAQGSDEKKLGQKVNEAVALLYSQGDDGTMQMRCTATAFEKIVEKSTTSYLFASAAHCVGNDDTQHENSADAKNIPFYITFDEHGVKRFFSATVHGVGYQHRGDDFLVVQVTTNESWTVIPLGDETKIDDGDDDETKIVNVASPLGLGKQIFYGNISKLVIDRPVIQGDINWRGAMFLQISAGPGSSGSAIVSVDQKAIVGFLVGTVGGNNIVAVPVSRFKKFWEGVQKGSYKWYSPEEEK